MPARSTRLFAILARAAPVGVILRRGPSKQVRLLKWHLRSDTLEPGQWFKGRIYERRCDLSPDGSLLVYFAAKHRKPYGTWTAISRTPWLTALALWPKGDAWGGGGVFESPLSLQLNHRTGEMALAKGFTLHPRMRVSPFGTASGWGEDFPIYDALLASRGWALVDRGDRPKPKWNAPIVWSFARPMVFEHAGPRGRRLQMRIKGINERNGAWWVVDHAVLDKAGAVLLDLPRTDWADWDRTDLVYSQGGRLFRVAGKSFGAGAPDPRLIADLSDMAFDPVPSPPAARRW